MPARARSVMADLIRHLVALSCRIYSGIAILLLCHARHLCHPGLSLPRTSSGVPGGHLPLILRSCYFHIVILKA